MVVVPWLRPPSPLPCPTLPLPPRRSASPWELWLSPPSSPNSPVLFPAPLPPLPGLCSPLSPPMPANVPRFDISYSPSSTSLLIFLPTFILIFYFAQGSHIMLHNSDHVLGRTVKEVSCQFNSPNVSGRHCTISRRYLGEDGRILSTNNITNAATDRLVGCIRDSRCVTRLSFLHWTSCFVRELRFFLIKVLIKSDSPKHLVI